MTYHAITPFRRSLNAVLVGHQKHRHAQNAKPVNKWEILRELSTARKEFDLSDRDLGVLRALLTFFPEAELSGENLIIYPSNAAISERLNGMPLSTLRRHIARLVSEGILLRRDSSNGKRFVKRRDGIEQAFGFDLTPLLSRAQEIQQKADQTRQTLAQISQLRQELVLMRRDLLGLSEYLCQQGHAIDHSLLLKSAADLLRRQAKKDELAAMKSQLNHALRSLSDLANLSLSQEITQEMSTKSAENERHYQNSNKDIIESETASINANTEALALNHSQELAKPNVALGQVLDLCKEIQVYAPQPVKNWPHLVAAADRVSSMMGITQDLWQRANLVMGRENAAIALASMLERFNTIRSPGAYLRTLVNKADMKLFSAGPMVRALQRPNLKSSQL